MAFVVQTVPIGTNIGLMHILWVMVNGSFLRSRGALFSALHLSGFEAQAIRRSWAALRYGSWEVNELLESWQLYVASQNQWRARRYERYRVLSVDITGFWRPRLQGWLGKHYHHLAQKALPAVVVGVMIISGQVGSQRIPLLRRIVRCQPHATSICQGRDEMCAESRFEKSPHQRLKCALGGGLLVVLIVQELLSHPLVNQLTSVFQMRVGESRLFAEIDVV
jgi:hypothetical protein